MSTEPEILASARPGGTRRRLVVAGLAAAALAVGGAVTAAAASAPSPSGSPSASPSGSAAPEAENERQHQPRLAGTVVSASGDTITVTDRDGFQRTIRTTADTEYADGLTATPAAGTRISAVGTVDPDKTSLLATRVAKLPERGAAGEKRGPHRGGPRPGGPDRPDRPGDRPQAPDSSATPGPSGSAGPTPSPSPTG